MIDNNVETCKALCDLIQSQMNLTANRVWIFNQKVDIPSDDGLFVSVACLRTKPLGSALNYVNDEETGKLVEFQALNIQETLRITLFSRDGSARQRRHEITFVLHSTAAQQMQERYSMQMGYTPTAVDVSSIEGAARLNKFSLTFSLLRAYTRTKPIEFYDQFQPTELLIEP